MALPHGSKALRLYPINGGWAFIAEIVSSVAILVTLLYLASQTKQNTDAIESQLIQSLVDSIQSLCLIMLNKPKKVWLNID